MILLCAANNALTTSAAILLNSPRTWTSALSSCGALSENLWSPHVQDFNGGLNSSLAYEVFSKRLRYDQLLWIGNQGYTSTSCRLECLAIDISGKTHYVKCSEELPALCTQNAPASNTTFADTTTSFQIAQPVGSQTLIGYRDFLTFRFMGVRFAPEPERFAYSKLYTGTGTNHALDPAPECLQSPGTGSTDCLFLNIWTTSLPSSRRPAKKDLKPVMVYIYGGGFTSGSASNPTNDGGNLAARGDVVVVDLAYRLSTLGFLALDDGVHNGNYWISDCIVGLQWVQKYIKSFGGDPSHVTIFGESAGAETVQALLATLKAKELFQGAILQSNYYEPYISIATSFNTSTLRILKATGCINASDQLDCLQAYNAAELINLNAISKYIPSSILRFMPKDTDFR